MDNGAQFVDKILEISGKDHQIQEIFSHKYHVSKAGAKLIDIPSVESTTLFSLNQATNFIKSLVESTKATEGSVMVNVVDETIVEIVDANLNENMERDTFARLDSTKIFERFRSGERLNQEQFIVELMTKFVQDDATKELLHLVSSIKSEGETSFKDSGFSQTVNVKAGVSLVNQKEIKNLFLLKTYRTFPEVEQPVIPYILRLHDGPGGKPLFALYAADGGQWKVEATKQIREYFSNQLKSKLAEKAESVIVL